MHLLLNCLIVIGVMVSMLASNVVDCDIDYGLGLTNNYDIGICCFSAK